MMTSPSGDHRGSTGRNRAPLQSIALTPIAITSIPPRPWAYGNFLLSGQAAALGAVDGGGKGSMTVAIALSMITGQDLLGERVWRTGPVAIVSYEDDQDEWHRRIAAACIYYRLDYDEVVSQVRFLSCPGGRIVFAAMQNGRLIYPNGEEIIAELRNIKAALLIVDPLNHAHDIENGNGNPVMAKVAAEFSHIAQKSGVACLVLHHLRKGSSGSADDLMGATSIRATFRSCRILARMTPDEAKNLGVGTEAWRYSQISASKENYSPPHRATWFRLESVSLDNGTDLYPVGDSVQVTAKWTPPPIFDGIENTDLADIFNAIRRGPAEGEQFSPSKKSHHWVGKLITKVAGKTDAQATIITRRWIDNDVLHVAKYHNPSNRKEVDGITLNDLKAREMTTLIGSQTDDD